MNLQRFSIFESDIPLRDQVNDSISKISEKPSKLSGLFWFFWIQICLAVLLLVASVLLPIWLMYG